MAKVPHSGIHVCNLVFNSFLGTLNQSIEELRPTLKIVTFLSTSFLKKCKERAILIA